MFPEGFAVPVKPFVEVQDQVAEAAAGGEAPAALIFRSSWRSRSGRAQ